MWINGHKCCKGCFLLFELLVRLNKFSPFYELDQREPILPVDVARLSPLPVSSAATEDCITNGNRIEYVSNPFDENGFRLVLNSMLAMRQKLHSEVKINIDNAQAKQKKK